MSFSEYLLKWYDKNRRTLPWRGEKNPYFIWLSEIMLQQTQIETVKGYYARFLNRFPNVFELARAPEDEVLKLWEGLGYYSRARNLHAAARRIVTEMNGVFPGDSEGLRKLPGIGPYAANAIASIAYNECVPALDGNQARVLSRIIAYEPPVKTPFDLLAPAMALISQERPGDYNQALMDLGAMICVPRQPNCKYCPVSGYCVAFKENVAEDFPHKPAPIPKREEKWTILVIECEGHILVRQRPKGLLGGLYEYHVLEGHPEPDAIISTLNAQGFSGITLLEHLPDSKHIFTHLIWRMHGYRLSCQSFPDRFIPADETLLSTLAFPSALRAYRC